MIEAYAYYNGRSVTSDFIECLEGAARECGVIITPEETRRKESVKKVKESIRESFCAQQLKGSGLTV